MSWRGWLRVLLGALLPVPLVLVLMTIANGARDPGKAMKLSPVLSQEERLQRATYLRHCEQSSECEPPMGCLKHWRLLQPACIDSDCVTDEQCEPGESCQTLQTEGSGPQVRLCIQQGVRREGERCRNLPNSRTEACEPGLRCLNEWCGRPCRPDTPGSCPEGFFCAKDAASPACIPTCEARDCPEGQQCVRFTKGTSQPASACVVVHGTNCQQSPCAEGEDCLIGSDTKRPGEAWMACRERCDKTASVCPPGFLCSARYCRQPCDPDVPGTCGPQERCIQHNPKDPWTCRFDY